MLLQPPTQLLSLGIPRIELRHTLGNGDQGVIHVRGQQEIGHQTIQLGRIVGQTLQLARSITGGHLSQQGDGLAVLMCFQLFLCRLTVKVG